MDERRPSAAFGFTVHPSASSFCVPVQDYLSDHPDEKLKYSYIAAGALVFDSSTPTRILLIQRAAKDSMPNRWEIPGGGCDDDDATILHSVARELWEEAGLHAVQIGPQVGDGHVFLTRSGKMVSKFNFLVDAEKGADKTWQVRLDPKEHQSHVWATEEEVKAGKVGVVELMFTTPEQEAIVLESFEAARKINSTTGQTSETLPPCVQEHAQQRTNNSS